MEQTKTQDTTTPSDGTVSTPQAEAVLFYVLFHFHL